MDSINKEPIKYKWKYMWRYLDIRFREYPNKKLKMWLWSLFLDGWMLAEAGTVAAKIHTPTSQPF
jgi:hypothetical protein